MSKHLFFDGISAYYEGVHDHPQKVMKELGIEYRLGVPESVLDGWMFWGCTNLPHELPSYLSIVKADPYAPFYGLSEEERLKISENE